MVNKREVKRELKSQHRPYREGEAIYHMYIHSEVRPEVSPCATW
jgi:hypothetical protein